MPELNIDNPQPIPEDVELPGMPERGEASASPADEPAPTLDLADIAAAAVTALEVLIEMLPDNLADEVVGRFEGRSAAFRTTAGQ